MKHRDIEERNWVEAYVLGRLSPEEEMRFEEHYAECPRCLEQLELAEDLGRGLRQLASEEARATLGAGVLAAVARRLNRQPLWWVAVLTALVLPASWLFLDNRRLADQARQARALVEQTRQQLEREAAAVKDLTAAVVRLERPLANVPAFLLSQVREGVPEAPPVISVEADEPWLSLAVEIEPEVETCSATLVATEGRVIWQEAELIPNLWGVLQLTFPRNLLPPGEYRLELRDEGRGDRARPIGSYPFRIAMPLE